MKSEYYHLTWAGYFWVSWIFVGAGFELFSLAYKAAWTLSRNTWAAEHLNMHNPLQFANWTPLHWSIAISLWLFCLFLSFHIPFGWLRP